MKVKELISELEKLDPELEVWSYGSEEVGYPTKAVVKNAKTDEGVPSTRSGWIPEVMEEAWGEKDYVYVMLE